LRIEKNFFGRIWTNSGGWQVEQAGKPLKYYSIFRRFRLWSWQQVFTVKGVFSKNLRVTMPSLGWIGKKPLFGTTRKFRFNFWSR
jgi:hypothetical protein